MIQTNRQNFHSSFDTRALAEHSPRLLMRFDILHRTRYSYETPVKDSFNELRLEPVTNEHQTVESFKLRVDPIRPVQRYEDFFKNAVHHFEVTESHSALTIESSVRVSTRRLMLPLDATPAPLSRRTEAGRSERCFDYLLDSSYVDLDPSTWRLALDAIEGKTDMWQASVAIMGFVHGYLKYTPLSTHVHSHMREVIEQRAGVCQDFAHVMLGLCRSVKIPALYVSGYLATETASATHAWIEVFIPDIGWRGLDPTHNRATDETYVKIGVGRDYADVAPIRGHYRGTTDRRMEVEVKITPLDGVSLD
ncbi:MAG TPA: transglutaminase family protein [Verrucomicrobiota bacterium]|nr:transglutaminase family protein [Verrucomicrobiota bacterium]